MTCAACRSTTGPMFVLAGRALCDDGVACAQRCAHNQRVANQARRASLN